MSAGDAERQPLLACQEQSVQDRQSTDDISVPITDLDASTLDIVKRTTYLWTVLWCIILISGGIAALILIKALIDAGDVDVSPL